VAKPPGRPTSTAKGPSAVRTGQTKQPCSTPSPSHRAGPNEPRLTRMSWPVNPILDCMKRLYEDGAKPHVNYNPDGRNENNLRTPRRWPSRRGRRHLSRGMYKLRTQGCRKKSELKVNLLSGSVGHPAAHALRPRLICWRKEYGPHQPSKRLGARHQANKRKLRPEIATPHLRALDMFFSSAPLSTRKSYVGRDGSERPKGSVPIAAATIGAGAPSPSRFSFAGSPAEAVVFLPLGTDAWAGAKPRETLRRATSRGGRRVPSPLRPRL